MPAAAPTRVRRPLHGRRAVVQGGHAAGQAGPRQLPARPPCAAGRHAAVLAGLLAAPVSRALGPPPECTRCRSATAHLGPACRGGALRNAAHACLDRALHPCVQEPSAARVHGGDGGAALDAVPPLGRRPAAQPRAAAGLGGRGPECARPGGRWVAGCRRTAGAVTQGCCPAAALCMRTHRSCGQLAGADRSEGQWFASSVAVLLPTWPSPEQPHGAWCLLCGSPAVSCQLALRVPAPLSLGWGPPVVPVARHAHARRLHLASPRPAALFPPSTALLLHVLLAWLTWNPGYCSTPLLAAPLSRQRQASLATALDTFSLPLAAMQPTAAQAPKLTGEPACRYGDGSSVGVGFFSAIRQAALPAAPGAHTQASILCAWPQRCGSTSPSTSRRRCSTFGCGLRRCASARRPPPRRGSAACGSGWPAQRRPATAACTATLVVARRRRRCCAPRFLTTLWPPAGVWCSDDLGAAACRDR